MKVTVTTQGFRELDDALGELPKTLGKATLRRVLMKAGQPIYEMAKRLAPARPENASPSYFGGKVVDEGGKRVRIGGKLRRPGTDKALVQIGTRLTRRQASAAKKAGKSFQEVYIGSRDRIARLIEYGTSKTRAVPYLRSAWDEHRDEALKIIGEELGGEIEATAARLAKKRVKAGG